MAAKLPKVVRDRIKLNDVRLSFPHLWTPWMSPLRAADPTRKAEPSYMATFIMPKGSPQHTELGKLIKDMIRETFGGAKPPAQFWIPLRDGAEKDQDGYGPETVFIAASNKAAPTKYIRKQELKTDDGTFYAGCYVNAIISLQVYDHNGGKGINAKLAGVQYYREGPALGSGTRIATADEFDDVFGDEDDFMGGKDEEEFDELLG